MYALFPLLCCIIDKPTMGTAHMEYIPCYITVFSPSLNNQS